MDTYTTLRDRLVFGLDIGTRSIVGTVGYKEGDKFVVVAQRSVEHQTRAMLDGQIHDVARVGNTILIVKSMLESVLGFELKDVCIAAAGRVLKTVDTHVEHEFEEEKVVEPEDVMSLVSKGVEQSYDDFNKEYEELNKERFYCVGYSVVRYFLNGNQITNLLDHKAKTISTDLIATFLPDDVVDGLYRAVEIAGLNVVNLTLEPIAAMQVAIPEKFRMLNLALVDVGAGTSDISITRAGSIVSYGMIPQAGDAMTELIMQSCLTDFDTAEQIKRDIGKGDNITYIDIMGLKQTIKKADALKMAMPAMEQETDAICECIKKLNGNKPVSAVFIVGGGGKIEGYDKLIAKKLGIAAERVAVRGEDVMGDINFLEDNVKKDSLLVTPIGICLSFYAQSNNFIFVNFNKERIKIYDNSKLTVVDAAIQAAFPNDGLFPKRGQELRFVVNGKPRIVRGLPGEAAVITVNGQDADIHTPIHSNDVVIVTESTAGEPAKQRLDELPEFKDTLKLIVEEKEIKIPRYASVNKELKTGSYEIQSGDDIEFLDYCTVAQLLEFMDLTLDYKTRVIVNNKVAHDDTKIYENFSVELVSGVNDGRDYHGNDESDYEDDGEIYEESSEEENESNDQNEEAVDQNEGKPAKSGNILTVIVNKNPITLKGKQNYVFVDIFEFINFDTSSMKGEGLVTTLNGENAEYMAPLKDGDVIEVYWKM